MDESDVGAEKHPSGAKARDDSLGFIPGINPRPTAPRSFCARAKGRVSFVGFFGTAKAVPFQNIGGRRIFLVGGEGMGRIEERHGSGVKTLADLEAFRHESTRDLTRDRPCGRSRSAGEDARTSAGLETGATVLIEGRKQWVAG